MTLPVPVGTLEITEAEMRAILDSPSNKFLGTDTIDIKTNMSFDYVNFKITISDFPDVNVKAGVMQFAAWQLYMVYIESISEYIKAQTPRIVENRLETFRKSAELFLKVLGISLNDKEQIALSKSSLQAVLTDTRDIEAEYLQTGFYND